MKRLIPYVLFGLLLGGCARHRIIPDDELALIFHDAFLTNAYLNTENVRPDSLRLYEPIFAHYGYTTEDVHYTIGNFSKRKSARLGDVVEEAIDLLEAEGKIYNREVAILDTIDNVALRTFTRPVVSDTLIRVSALRDAARRAPWADCRDGTASYAFPALEPEPCSRRDGVQDYARRGEAQGQVYEPRDAVPEVRDARHAARAQGDNPHTPETPAAVECSRQKDKDNR